MHRANDDLKGQDCSMVGVLVNVTLGKQNMCFCYHYKIKDSRNTKQGIFDIRE